MRQYWIVKGTTSGPDGAFPEVPEGTTEWQFSDGPAGERSESADYLSLEEGLRAHCPAIFHFEG
jgi:hypothetical protein